MNTYSSFRVREKELLGLSRIFFFFFVLFLFCCCSLKTMDERKSSSIYPDAELFTREYSAPTGPPLHSDSYMQQQIDLLSGTANQQKTQQSVVDVYGQSAYKQQQHQVLKKKRGASFSFSFSFFFVLFFF